MFLAKCSRVVQQVHANVKDKTKGEYVAVTNTKNLNIPLNSGLIDSSDFFRFLLLFFFLVLNLRSKFVHTYMQTVNTRAILCVFERFV